MAGYIRQDVSNNIANGNVIDADDFDNEFDAIAGAFNTSTGHSHDGSSAEGAPITVVGPAQDVIVSAIAVTPKTDDAYDLGSASNEWKDLYVDGTAYIDTLAADAGTVDGSAITTAANTQILTNKTLNLSSNTLTATSAQLAAALTDETGTGSVVFSGSPALTGVPTAPTAAADTNTTQLATTAHVFAERTNTTTLTNKTLTSPTISGGTISGGTISGGTISGGTISGGTISGITDLAIADGGTGASTAAQALINFGISSTAAELNYNDITTLGVSQASKVVTSDANGVTTFADGVNEGFTSVTSTSNATTINCRDGNVFNHALTEDTTFTFSNPPSSGTAYGFMLKLVQDTTARSVTWPASVDWVEASAPIISSNSGGVDMFVFVTHDSGVNWYGFIAGQGLS